MTVDDETRATLVALVRRIGTAAPGAAELIEREGPRAALDAALGAGASLLPEDPAPFIAQAEADIARWRDRGLRLTTVLDEDYPDRLRTVHDRPPLLFLAGDPALLSESRAVAIVGSRRASPEGLDAARRFATDLAQADHVVISGLAAGIDAAAHQAAVGAGGRTLALIGNGHEHVFPAEHAALQAELAHDQAVVSPFWPETGVSADGLRRRNGVISGLSLGSVIVEATQRSGTRVLARLALAHGRPVFLRRALLAQTWAADLARRPGVHVIDSAADVLELTRRLGDEGPLVDDARRPG